VAVQELLAITVTFWSWDFPQNRGYFHKIRCFKALDSRGLEEHIHFTGGAILQKERVNKELSPRTGNGTQPGIQETA